MELLDQYLKAVSSWLPREQRADIVAELSEDLRSDIAERERTLGRALDEAELCAVLERRGHPMWVAEGYLPQRSLIGPAVLPLYWRVLTIAIPSILAVFVVLGLIFTRLWANAPPQLTHPGFWIWQWGLWTFAYVGLFTLIFALVERTQARARAAGHWDPRDPHGLPSLPPDPDAQARQRQRVNAIAEIVANLLVLAWWLSTPSATLPALGITLAPIWLALHWPIALFLIAAIGVAAANAIRPSWSRGRLATWLAIDGFALALTGILLAAGSWFDVSSAVLPEAAALRIEKWTNLVGLQVLLVVGLTYAARAVEHARRIAGREPSANWFVTLVTGE